MNVAIVGLGLIGGSLAKTFSAHGHRVYGMDKNPQTMEQALQDGAVADVLDDVRMAHCDLVLICLYPQKTVDYILEKQQIFAGDTVVLDVCGVKEFVCREIEPVAAERGFTFVGAHPMAGRELSGYRASMDNLFHHASMILTPNTNTDSNIINKLANLFYSLEFRKVVVATPQRHDEIIAITSQLAHIVSNCYVKSPTAQDFGGFSAGSFKDLTRVAKLNEEMWTDLFSKNRPNLLRELDIFLENLQRYRDALAQEDDTELCALLRQGREIKEALRP